MIDLEAVARDRDQLWAEAGLAEAGGEALVIPEQLWPDVAEQQEARMELDPWEDALAGALSSLMGRGKAKRAKTGEPLVIDGKFAEAADALGNPEWRVSTDHLLTDVFCLPKERQHNNHTKRLATHMRSLGWTRHEKAMRIGTGTKRGFTKAVELGGIVTGQSAVVTGVTGVTGTVTEKMTPYSPPTHIRSSHSDVIPVTPVTKLIRRA